MGFGGVSLWQLAIVLGIVILLFGTKKLRNIGGDLGGAVKGFKKAMSEGVLTEDKKAEDKSIESNQDAEFVEASVEQTSVEKITDVDTKTENKS